MQLKLKSSKNAALASGLNSTQLLYRSSLDVNDFQSLVHVGEWKGGFITLFLNMQHLQKYTQTLNVNSKRTLNAPPTKE